MVAGHDDGVGDGADVVEDFLELSFAAEGGGFDFEVVVDDGESGGGETWHEEVDSKEDAAAVFEFALEPAVNEDVSGEAADFFDGGDGFQFVMIPVVRLGLEGEGGGAEDGLTREHGDAEEALVAFWVGRRAAFEAEVSGIDLELLGGEGIVHVQGFGDFPGGMEVVGAGVTDVHFLEEEDI